MTIQLCVATMPRQLTVRAEKIRTTEPGCRSAGGSNPLLDRSASRQSPLARNQ
jgi:hypothetical protein